MAKHTRMVAFKLKEISAVDKPAQAPALATILKRDSSGDEYWKRNFTEDQRKELADAGKALPDGSFPIANTGDLANAVRAYGRAKNKGEVKAHIIARAKSLKATDTLPDGWVEKAADEELVDAIAKRYLCPEDGALTFQEVLDNMRQSNNYSAALGQVWNTSEGPSQALSAFQTSASSIIGDANLDVTAKQRELRTTVESFLTEVNDKWPEVQAALAKQFLDEGETHMPDVKKVEDLEKQIADLTQKLKDAPDAAKMAELTKNVEALTAKLAEADAALAKAKMSKEEQEYFDGLKDDAEKGKFTAMSADDRKKTMAKALEGDETLTVDGQTVRKSVIGAESFGVMKAMFTRDQQRSEQLAKAQDEALTAAITKRVEDGLAELPGTTLEKVAVLKAVKDLPEAVRKTLDTMLETGNKALKAAFSTIGHRGSKEVEKAANDFNKRVSEIQARDKISKSEALSKARKEYPAEFEAFQANPAESN